jgi:hypothetical protein
VVRADRGEEEEEGKEERTGATHRVRVKLQHRRSRRGDWSEVIEE